MSNKLYTNPILNGGMGIYKMYFKCRPTLFYIGSSIDFRNRWAVHIRELKRGSHKNKFLKRLYKKYGLNNLIFEVIEIVESSVKLIEREQYFIDTLNPLCNILKSAGSCLGFKHTDITKKYLSSLNKGHKMTDEQNIRNSIAQAGNKNAKGAIRSEECKKNLSIKRQKKVVNTLSGYIFNSIGLGAENIGIKYQTLCAKLNGRNFNNTNLKFL